MEVFQAGERVWFQSEVKPYRVRACDDRFAICTKPFNLQRTVMYTIIDLERNVRGTENLIFCMGFETDQECEDALIRLQNGESKVSYRNVVSLDIIKRELRK